MRFILFAAVLLSSSGVLGCEHLSFGVPKQSDFVGCREGYAIGYSYSLKSAEWVAYRLDVQADGEGVDRKDNFREDPDIPAEYQTTPEDYEEPDYHQGHLANAESIDTSFNAMDETFLMSNMVPQLPTHNTGIWKGLENRERKWANKRGTVYVYTGPLYEGEVSHIGNHVPVPTHLWKVIYDPSAAEAIAYIIEHKALYTRQLDNYLDTIDSVEDSASIDLLSSLPISEQVKIESFKQPRQWE